MFNNNLPLVLTAWMIVVFIMMIARSRRHTAGVGLVLAYVLNLWLMHWAASAIYLLPWYHGVYEAFTISGTEQSLYAVAAFAFGSLAVAPFVVDSGILPRATGVHIPDQRLPMAYLLVGGGFYLVNSTALGSLPTVSAVVAAGQELTVVGLGLCWWQAWVEKDAKKRMLWLGLSFCLPFLTVITRGFIGYGALATMSVLIFISNFAKSRIKVMVIGTVLAYVALSVFVTYMRDRGEIRHQVWGGASFGNRFDQLEATASSFEFFDPSNLSHLQRMDDRLNQSYILGAAVAHLHESNDFAEGETLINAALALVPRVLWPDKPVTAGSGNLVARFTGFSFAGGTSVGIGAVTEFYVNFGTAGVLVGFVLLGVIVTSFDLLATERLVNGDLHGFIFYYLPGLALLQVGGQLVEVTASAAGSLVVAFLVNKFLNKYQQKQSNTVLAVNPDQLLQQHL